MEKHHAGYVKKLNAAIEKDSSLQGKSLEELVTGTTGGVFNNAAQVWNPHILLELNEPQWRRRT